VAVVVTQLHTFDVGHAGYLLGMQFPRFEQHLQQTPEQWHTYTEM
jgi:hypothetical protein